MNWERFPIISRGRGAKFGGDATIERFAMLLAAVFATCALVLAVSGDSAAQGGYGDYIYCSLRIYRKPEALYLSAIFRGACDQVPGNYVQCKTDGYPAVQFHGHLQRTYGVGEDRPFCNHFDAQRAREEMEQEIEIARSYKRQVVMTDWRP